MLPGDARGMLEGIRVVDMTSVLFGPYCTSTLAELGADVIKIESGSGDFTRLPGHPARTPGMGGVFVTLNAGKRSFSLNLNDPRDMSAMRALISTADVFIHNVRAGGIGRLGLDYAEVAEIRPDIIYVHLVGYGSDGPLSGMKAFDDTIQAASGVTSLAGLVDGNSRPRFVPSAIADKVGGLHAIYAVMGGIIHRLRTGQGQAIEVPMFEAFTHFLLQEHLCDATFDPPTGPIGYQRQLQPDRQPYPTKDGHVAIAPYTDDEWVRLLTLLGAQDLLQTPELKDRAARTANFALMYRTVSALTHNWRTAALVAECDRQGIAAVAVTKFTEVLDNPHLAATGFFSVQTHPTEGSVVKMRCPVKFGAKIAENKRPAPHVGEHNKELLTELGLN